MSNLPHTDATLTYNFVLNTHEIEDAVFYQHKNSYYKYQPDGHEWACLDLRSLEWGACDFDALREVPQYFEVDERVFNDTMAELDMYSCSLSGGCEPHFDGVPLAECQATCQGSENKDVTYLSLQYDPLQALELPFI
jgi:hypothetical protein